MHCNTIYDSKYCMLSLYFLSLYNFLLLCFMICIAPWSPYGINGMSSFLKKHTSFWHELSLIVLLKKSWREAGCDYCAQKFICFKLAQLASISCLSSIFLYLQCNECIISHNKEVAQYIREGKGKMPYQKVFHHKVRGCKNFYSWNCFGYLKNKEQFSGFNTKQC